MITSESGIYKITCSTNQYFYVGSAVNIKRRWEDHRRRLRTNTHYNHILQSTYNKYGESTFVVELLELAPRDQLLLIENIYIKKSYGLPKCMNLTMDASAPMMGKIPWNKGKTGLLVHTKKARESISKNNARYWNGVKRPELSKAFKGHKVSDATREKIKQSLVGKPLSEETKQKMKGRVPWNKGKVGVQVPWNKGITKNKMGLYESTNRAESNVDSKTDIHRTS